MPTRRLILSRLILACLSALSWLVAGAVVSADTPVYLSKDGAAINGYDPVAYFTESAPVRGRPENAVMWKGALWYFASARNREKFEANPRAYAPQYGGYCAYAVSQGFTDETDPNAWRIVDGKLYLTNSPVAQRLWARDIPGHVSRANANWPDVLNRK